MNKITIILKPTFECNFRCKYCYHSDTDYIHGKMSVPLFEELIKKTVDIYDKIHLIFHGGEPLLVGYDFYSSAFEIIRKYQKREKQFELAMQTNGFFLDDKFMALFRKNNVSVSASIDGPGKMNDLREKGDIVFSKIKSLKNKGYQISLLGVTHKGNIKDYKRYYNYAKKNGYHLKVNPIFASGEALNNETYLLDSSTYIKEMKKMIKTYLNDPNPLIHFYPLYNYAQMAILGRGKECAQGGCLEKFICVNYDGSIYPCGRSYPKEYELGNIKEYEKLSDAFKCQNYRKILEESIIRCMDCKNKCDLYSCCMGGCNNSALLAGDITKPNQFDCDVYHALIPFIKEYIEKHQIRNKDVIELMHKKKGIIREK